MEGYVGWVAETLQASGRFDVTVITTGTGRARPAGDATTASRSTGSAPG